MINFIGKLPPECTIAFSGGIDSVTITDFLIRGKKNISIAFFNHGTKASQDAEIFAKKFAFERRLNIKIGHISRERNKDESQEEHWRNERYNFLHSIDGPVITGHHLDDAVETWLFNSIHGNPRIIPYNNKNVIRPFLITPKSEFVSWCNRHHLNWMEDQSNFECIYMRNLIRQKIVPEALKVNPGLRKVIKKMYLNKSNIVV